MSLCIMARPVKTTTKVSHSIESRANYVVDVHQSLEWGTKNTSYTADLAALDKDSDLNI